MTHTLIAKRIALMAGMLIVLVSAAGAQQLTTGTLSGVVIDQQGGALPGVSITAVHEPTSTQYVATTDAEGRFQIPNVRVGGPYTVTATLSGFADQRRGDLVVALGEAADIELKMGLAGVTETVQVIGNVTFTPTRAGTAENISQETLEALPTISRGIFDFARTSAFFNLNPDSAGGDSFISVAGRNNRYNNIQIDGSVNNDVYGIPSTGTPGGQTGSQPISLDAIQEVQLVVAPYDVRQGGFSGGGINAITRSGANQFSGTAYWFSRNEGLVGAIPRVATPANPDPPETEVGAFTDRQGGFSIGGPIVRDRAFFFGNLDFGRKSTPSGFSVSGNSGQRWGNASEVQQVVDLVRTRFGFDPGDLDEVSTPTDSDKMFVRTDFNIGTNHRLTARVNYLDGERQTTSGGIPSVTAYSLPSAYYVGSETIWTPVVQLNSSFASAFNELRVSFNRQRFARANPDFPLFPYIRVNLSSGTNLRLGTENSSHANALNQDIWEVTNDLTWVRGNHTITVGTHNEFFHFVNTFIQNLYGNYEFNGLDNFAAGLAQGFQRGFSNTSDPRQPADFTVQQWGAYAGDQWRVRNDLTLTYGLRVDIPHFPDKPRANPITVANYGFATDVAPSPLMWSPRVGFNWDLTQDAAIRSQLRGGIGLFTGRTPYVWLSNQYSGTGLDFTTISATTVATNQIPFVADPLNQPTTVTGAQAGRQSVNLVDPDYQFPTVVRGNLAYDRDLGFWGLLGTTEFLFTENVHEVLYQNLNYRPNGQTRIGGRLVYEKVDLNLNDALLLTNTGGGYSWTITAKVERPFRNGFYASGSYLYNRARSINDGTASTAGSNWANTPVRIDVNNPDVTRSNFDTGSRINLTASLPIPLWGRLRSTASFFYNGQAGRPYEIRLNNDANGDGRTANDIAYIPASEGEVAITNGTWSDLDAFINDDDASQDNRGVIPFRNSGRAPWSHQLDFRYAVNIPTPSRASIELTMDVFNLLNLFNADWGWQYFPLFPASGNGLIGYSYNAATNTETYNLSTINGQNFAGTFQRDDVRSRWQAQWGARVRF